MTPSHPSSSTQPNTPIEEAWDVEKKIVCSHAINLLSLQSSYGYLDSDLFSDLKIGETSKLEKLSYRK
jgi:hypothetical protein